MIVHSDGANKVQSTVESRTGRQTTFQTSMQCGCNAQCCFLDLRLKVEPDSQEYDADKPRLDAQLLYN